MNKAKDVLISLTTKLLLPTTAIAICLYLLEGYINAQVIVYIRYMIIAIAILGVCGGILEMLKKK